jgi:hypothetical protein
VQRDFSASDGGLNGKRARTAFSPGPARRILFLHFMDGNEEIGPRMLTRIAGPTGLKPTDL